MPQPGPSRVPDGAGRMRRDRRPPLGAAIRARRAGTGVLAAPPPLIFLALLCALAAGLAPIPARPQAAGVPHALPSATAPSAAAAPAAAGAASVTGPPPAPAPARAARGAEAEGEAPGDVNVGYFPLPPYIIDAPGEVPAGFAADVLTEAARDVALRIVWRAYRDPGEALAGLRRGEVQVLATLGVSEERRESLSFTRPLAQVRVGLFADAADADRLEGAWADGDLAGARVGYQAGSLGGALAAALPNGAPVPVPGFLELVRRLAAGEVDAAILVESAFERGAYALDSAASFARVGPWLRESALAIGVDRRLPGLARRLDAGVEALMTGGRFAEIEARWFGPQASWWSRARIIAAAGVAILTGACGLGVAVWMMRERDRARRLAEARRFGAEQARLAEALAFKNSELESRSRDIERLLYVVSHDLKSPLVSIGGFARRLERHLEQDDREKAAAAAERISRNVQAMSDLIEGILRMGRAGTGQARLEWVEVDAVADAVAEQLSGRLERARARLLVMRPLPVVRADPVLLRQALQNLVENALRYGCPEPGMTVEIVSRSRDGLVEIGVRDEGPGVTEADRAGIFDLYRRGLGAAASKEEGAGLGLATVRRIAERHGGRSTVESRPGRGATFWIGVPASTASATAALAAAAPAGPGREASVPAGFVQAPLERGPAQGAKPAGPPDSPPGAPDETPRSEAGGDDSRPRGPGGEERSAA